MNDGSNLHDKNKNNVNFNNKDHLIILNSYFLIIYLHIIVVQYVKLVTIYPHYYDFHFSYFFYFVIKFKVLKYLNRYNYKRSFIKN